MEYTGPAPQPVSNNEEGNHPMTFTAYFHGGLIDGETKGPMRTAWPAVHVAGAVEDRYPAHDPDAGDYWAFPTLVYKRDRIDGDAVHYAYSHEEKHQAV